MRDEYNKKPTDSQKPFPVLQTKGADGQLQIEAKPDAFWAYNKKGPSPILKKAGYLLVTMGQGTASARLTAVASDVRYVGQGWMPVTGINPTQSKAAATFLNSTPGRLMIMQRPGKTIPFPFYNPASWLLVGLPDIDDQHIVGVLADCWEATRYEIVPQYRDGYTPIRQTWDKAVAEALGWDLAELNELGELLAKEPHVRGIGYNQWKE